MCHEWKICILGHPQTSGIAAAEVKPRCVYSISKPHGQSFRRQVTLLLSYVYSILKPHIQSSKSPSRLLQHEARPKYIYTTLTLLDPTYIWSAWDPGGGPFCPTHFSIKLWGFHGLPSKRSLAQRYHACLSSQLPGFDSQTMQEFWRTFSL